MFRREDIPRRWFLIDAEDLVLGRLASAVASRLRGKDTPFFTPHEDTGDHVIVVNAEKILTTGNKAEQKTYHSHSEYPGGIKTVPFARRMKQSPESIITKAVKGMLPKNRLGRQMIRKLRVYRGSDHPHTAQSPEDMKI